MREIEFRGQNINGHWAHGNLAIIKEKLDRAEIGAYISNSAGAPFAYQVRPETIGQYTGLKDKNGKKIFEGDIVRNINGEYSYIGIVNKDRYTFYIKGVAPKDNYDFADVSDTVTGKSSLIVICNIHENPELLEVAK
ncbi:YopX family protein [Listeria cossartiae]|uniref:YopX family protein n=1 Tax=Listeria cossartiae TaxID=2838249 RepID=UPI001E4C8AF0|nr:YopX family protein [Listeria cossartiae]MCD2225526.1 YopX family protein [Listeria cossartiae]MCD2240277.1 YopX family protein [Listeria cossartiae]